MGDFSAFAPGRELSGELFAMARCARQMPFQGKVRVDRTEARKEWLRAFTVADAPHAPLALAGRIMARSVHQIHARDTSHQAGPVAGAAAPSPARVAQYRLHQGKFLRVLDEILEDADLDRYTWARDSSLPWRIGWLVWPRLRPWSFLAVSPQAARPRSTGEGNGLSPGRVARLPNPHAIAFLHSWDR
ncbi:hypothetical protein CF70_002435 [Cupriavidus sp. SK-3]|nr:hypothetical protein CF70_002435 [Cupriavidus sp. SK-3]